jgi:hypothetical protein
MVGQPLDPWGVTAVEALTAYGPGGAWVSLEAALKMPRQVGKTKGIMIPIALTVSTVFDPSIRLWTAHTEKAYLEAFELAKQLIDGSDEFSRRVAHIREADGDKGIEFTNGSVLDFAVRSAKVGRARGLPELFMDEALFLKATFVNALLPTMAAQHNPRVWYFSSAAVETEDSDHLRSLTTRGRSGRDHTIVLVEHCAPGGWVRPGCEQASCDHAVSRTGCALDREDLWHAAIPSLGIRTSVAFIRTMRQSMTPLGFGTEFMGWDQQPSGASASPISVADWAALADPESRREPDGRVALAVDISRDRSWASIAWCGRREDGRSHVELVRHGRGAGWVVAALDELAGKVPLALMEPRANDVRPSIVGDTLALKPLAPDLLAVGLEPVLLGASQVAAACAGLQDDVVQDRVRHLGQRQVDDAVAGACKRDVGDGGWAWGKKASAGVDITPLYAVTLARWALAESLPEFDPMSSFG